MANDDVWNDTAPGEGTPANAYEMLLDVLIGSSFVRTADITNLNPQSTPITRQRQTYAVKGRNSSLKTGDDVVVTFDMEVIRDGNGQFQPVLQTLVNRALEDGLANLATVRYFDALGADYAFQGRFSVSMNRTNTGWQDAAFITFTLTQFDDVERIPNPVLEGLVPVLRAVSPAGAEATETAFLEGDNLAAVTAVTLGGTPATNVTPLSNSLVSFTVPAGDAGPVPVIATSPEGASDEFTYTRG